MGGTESKASARTSRERALNVMKPPRRGTKGTHRSTRVRELWLSSLRRAHIVEWCERYRVDEPGHGMSNENTQNCEREEEMCEWQLVCVCVCVCVCVRA